MAAEDSNISEDLFHANDEVIAGQKRINYDDYATVDPFSPVYEVPVSDQLFVIQSKIIQRLAANGPCVIIGRCANYAFSDRQDKISIFLSGDKSDRIRHIAKKHDFSEKKAKAVVDETDSRRREFHKYCSNQEWGNAAFYDLCIDETKAGVDGTVDIIKKYIEIMA